MNLTAKNLKEKLWNTLQCLEKGDIEVGTADAIASQSREIVKVIRSQQSILRQANKNVTTELVQYATK